MEGRGLYISHFAFSLIAIAAMFAVSLLLGRYHIPPSVVAALLLNKVIDMQVTWPDAAETVVFRIRLPRAILAALVGGGLAISGASFQGMFRNPLVSPDLLGVSAGAGFGAALAILLSGHPAVVQVAAFAFGIIAVLLAYGMAHVGGTSPLMMLVLAGIVVGAMFSAAISFVILIADPYSELQSIVFWLMGSLSTASLEDALIVAPGFFVGVGGLLLLRWQLNVLSIGDEEARSVGLRTELVKSAAVIFATLITASATSISGIVGWVGLLIPHIARMLVGHDNMVLLPLSLTLGAAYLLAVDNIARTVAAGEIPLGILTALVGAPVFLVLLRKTRGRWLS